MSTAREPVRFNAQDSNEQTINKLNRLVDELYTKLSAAELRLTQTFQLLKNPTSGYVLTTDADGKGTWQEAQGGESGGSDTQVQYNAAGEFAGDSGMTYNAASGSLSVTEIIPTAITGFTDCSGANVDLSGTLEVDGQVNFNGDVVFSNTNDSVLIGASRKIYIKPGTAPATSTSTGTQGRVVFDATYIYYCYATNQWKRIPFNSF